MPSISHSFLNSGLLLRMDIFDDPIIARIIDYKKNYLTDRLIGSGYFAIIRHMRTQTSNDI